MIGAVRQICGTLALGAVLSGTMQAQAATVSGQVSITERPGEVTEDLGNVVVFLEPASGVRPSSPAARGDTGRAIIALQSRQFSPRVRVVNRGATVEFPNQDPFSHNVFSKMNGGFDTGVFGRGRSRDQRFEDPGVYALYCNVHPRMTGFVITLATPYYTQAGADGRFRIENVPPGDYTMTVWHDRATKETQRVTVTPMGLSGVRVALDARGYRYVQHKDKNGRDYTSARGDRY